MKILVSAAEVSADLHGAALVQALRAENSQLEFFGMGGVHLEAVGLSLVVDVRRPLGMGFTELWTSLPRIYTAFQNLIRAAEIEKPDLAIVIDYPGFHFKLAKALKKMNIPIVYYIPPKVWAWRTQRVFLMKALFDLVLGIFPFEEEFYKRFDVPFQYVGNPLLNELPLTLSKKEARSRLGLQEEDFVIVCMPGSRYSEIHAHAKLMLQAVKQAIKNEPKRIRLLMPFPSAVRRMVDGDAFEQDLRTHYEFEILFFYDRASECLLAADLGVIKSGTSTLEAALLRCPHVVIYQTNLLTAWIFKYWIRYQGPIGLVNLMLQWAKQGVLVRELICREVTVQALADEISALMLSPSQRKVQEEAFQVLLAKLMTYHGEETPSRVAAQSILNFCRRDQTDG